MKKFGRYEIVEELGRGAMGVVYKAADPTIGRLVALKVLSLESDYPPGVPGLQDIFMREARAAGRLAHPAIVTIHDAFEDPDTKSSCIVMELVPGRTLENVLLSGPQFSVEQTLEIVRQVADALDYAHRRQVIHRDLKPANILLSEDGRAKLTDFGIAKIMAREGAMRTAALLGTPSYMSPEQVTGKDIDARSDLFSLGIILYLMLTGDKPFTGDAAAVMFKIVYEDPVAPSKLNAQLSPAHDYLVLRLLAKERAKRYGSARQFLEDLEDVRSGRPPRGEAKVPASELPIGERTILMRAPAVPPPGEAPLPPRTKARWASAGLGVALVILAGVLSVVLWKGRHPKALPPSAAREARQAAVAPVPLATLPMAPLPQSAMPPLVGGPSGQESLSALPKGTESTAAYGRQGTKVRVQPKPRAAPHLPVTAGKSEALPTPGGAPAAQPARTAAAPAAANPVPAPSPAPSPASTSLAAGKPASAPGKIQLWCKYELKEGKLSVSNGAQEISKRDLKGRKKGGLRHLTGGYEGLLSYTLAVPPGTHDLTVRVTSSDAGTDLSKTIPFAPPAGVSPLLEVIVTRDGIQLSWRSPAPSKP